MNQKGCLQTDDKSALLEISRQLQLDNVINDKVFGSFSDSFDFLLRSFRSGSKMSKPLIFIMEEFDLFTKNKTQLLLYTLLNTIQSSSNPMCLIGVTCRIDVLDLLEKRIKSRFSHRQIYLFNEYDFTKFIEMTSFFMKNTEALMIPSKNSKILKYIDEYVDEFLKDAQVLKLLNRQFEYDKSISTLKRLMVLPTLKLNYLDTESLKNKDLIKIKEEFKRSIGLLNIDTKSALLNGLSILELTLVVVMLDLSETFIDQPFNFDIVHKAYIKFCQKKNWHQQKHEKQVILKVIYQVI